jgi:hypothetical protein
MLCSNMPVQNGRAAAVKAPTCENGRLLRKSRISYGLFSDD